MAYHAARGDHKRTKVIVPDSSHGTNPATAALCGCSIIQIPSNEAGGVDLEALRKAVGEDTAALMLTNPSTLGLFETEIVEIAQIVHGAGGLLYYDGANMNAIMGYARPGDMGFDVIHFNLHKTFSTPHGGGGPGSGPVGVKGFLEPFLPKPVVQKEQETGKYYFDYDRPQSIGKVKAFYGNFGVVVKAYTYLKMLGGEGVKAVSEKAVLNANYLMSLLSGTYHQPFSGPCMHEFIVTPKTLKEYGIRTMDVAKRLIDYGFHPPTVYFPLIVEEALMIEPTETESKETLDDFAAALLKIAAEAKENPQFLHEAPHTTPVSRMDEATAARKPVIRWRREGSSE
jgi:glycine dehydrogenase subunit 2